MRLVAALEHIGHFAACCTEHLDALTRIFAWNIDCRFLDGLEQIALVVLLDDHARASNLEFKSFTTHRFHQDGQMQKPTTSYFYTRFILGFTDTHRDVALRLFEQTLLQLSRAHDLTLAANKRRSRGLKHDRHRRLFHFDRVELDRVFTAGDHIADVGIFHANHCDDVASRNLLLFFFTKGIKGEYLLDDGVVSSPIILDHEHLLVFRHRAREQAPHSDTTNEA